MARDIYQMLILVALYRLANGLLNERAKGKAEKPVVARLIDVAHSHYEIGS